MGFVDDVRNKAEALGDQASGALDTAKDKADAAWDTVTDKTEEVVEVIKDKTSGFVDSVKERFDSGAEPPPSEPVEDFAAAGPAPDPDSETAVVEEAAAELQRHSQPGQL